MQLIPSFPESVVREVDPIFLAFLFSFFPLRLLSTLQKEEELVPNLLFLRWTYFLSTFDTAQDNLNCLDSVHG